MTWWIGTSGWQYADWRQPADPADPMDTAEAGLDARHLYPATLTLRRWLERHAERFATVELNASFYRLPKRETFVGWAARTPAGYLFAVKASRYLSHVRRLREPEEPVARLLDRSSGLGVKRGPILLQLPPDFAADPDALAHTLRCFGAGVRVAVELRHASWWEPPAAARTERVLAEHGAALVWADREGRSLNPLWRTSDWGYLRLHHGGRDPAERDWSYRPERLVEWVEQLVETYGPRHDVFVYTNNDPGGAALLDANRLIEEAMRRGLPVARAVGAA